MFLNILSSVHWSSTFIKYRCKHCCAAFQKAVFQKPRKQDAKLASLLTNVQKEAKTISNLLLCRSLANRKLQVPMRFCIFAYAQIKPYHRSVRLSAYLFSSTFELICIKLGMISWDLRSSHLWSYSKIPSPRLVTCSFFSISLGSWVLLISYCAIEIVYCYRNWK